MSCRFFTCDTDYCDKTRSCDDMLEQFSKDRREVVDLLNCDNNEKEKEKDKKITNILWSSNSPISKDGNCLFRMGKELKLSIEDMLEKNCEAHTLFNYYICPQCKNLRRLIDFAETGPNIPFALQCGSKAGSLLYYEEVVSPLTQLVFSNPKGNKDKKFLFVDDFTRNFLINWFVTEETSSKVKENIQKLYISFICNDNGYNLYEYCELIDIGIFQENTELLSDNGKPSPTSKPDDKVPLKKEVVTGILTQLICLLHYLSKFKFSYEGFKLSNLKFKKVPISYVYEKVQVSSPVTLKLSHFERSAISVFPSFSSSSSSFYRLCHKSIIEEENLNKDLKRKSKWDKEKEEYFTIPVKLKEKRLFMYMKNLGLLEYASSFDLYAFFTMLMTDRAFYSAVITDKGLYTLWRSLWTEKSFGIITNRIVAYHDQSKIPETQDQVLDLIQGIDLLPDALSRVFNAL